MCDCCHHHDHHPTNEKHEDMHEDSDSDSDAPPELEPLTPYCKQDPNDPKRFFLTEDEGIIKEIIKPGKEGGKTPPHASQVTVHYVGTLDDGTKFDSSRDRNQPFQFKLGTGNVIKGWDTGVATMVEGEICNLIVKPQYGYGDRETGKIPPNSTLHFEIELLDFERVMTDEDKLNFAAEKKSEGNALIATGDFAGALAIYQKGFSTIEHMFPSGDVQTKRHQELLLQMHLNMAHCYLKLNNPSQALVEAGKVVEKDAQNVKGLFRRGSAHRLLQNFDEAKKDLLSAIKLAPAQQALRDEYQRVLDAEKAFHASQKKIFANMFGRMAALEEKEKKVTEPTPAPVPAPAPEVPAAEAPAPSPDVSPVEAPAPEAPSSASEAPAPKSE